MSAIGTVMHDARGVEPSDKVLTCSAEGGEPPALTAAASDYFLAKRQNWNVSSRKIADRPFSDHS